MRKRLVATLLVGAVATTAVIGLSACGGAGIEKGVQVDEQGWKDAFKASVEAKNFTTEQITETKGSTSGSVGDISVNVKMESNENLLSYYDVDGGKSYEKGTAKMKITGVKDLDETIKQVLHVEDDIDETEDYESYIVKEGDTYYEAIKENGEWAVDESYGVYAFSILSHASYATEATGEDQALSLLYSAFTYSGGIYTATLYNYGQEYTVSVSIKDGYVIGYSVEYKMEGEQSGITVKTESKQVYKYSNYGNTTVNPSNDAKNAIENRNN